MWHLMLSLSVCCMLQSAFTFSGSSFTQEQDSMVEIREECTGIVEQQKKRKGINMQVSILESMLETCAHIHIGTCAYIHIGNYFSL